MFGTRSTGRPLAVASVALSLATSGLAGQITYAKAEQLLPWHTSLLVSGDEVVPQWLSDGNRFWYRNKTAAGAEFVLIDPVRNARTLVFDNARLAAAMSVARDTTYDPNTLPFRTFRFGSDGKNEREIEFSANRQRFICDIAAYRCTVGDSLPSEVPFVASPDKQWEAFVHGNNVYVRPKAACAARAERGARAAGCDSTQLTTDGVDYWSYGLTMPRPGDLVRRRPRRPQIRWSPDSKKLAVMRADERGVAMMPYISYTPQRPRLYQQPYALPGDTVVPKPGFHIIDVATKGNIAVALSPRPNQLSINGSARDSAWSAASDRIYVTYFTRASKSAYLAEVDARTGAARILARDTSKTFVEIAPSSGGEQASWRVTKDGKEIFWWSERDGWAHLYRLDGAGATQVAAGAGDGGVAVPVVEKVKQQITAGAWAVGSIQHVDEAAKHIYFTARGREPGRNCYYAHLYRVSYDGTGLTLLTPEDAHHEIRFSPSGRYFVDRYSRIEKPPITVLRAAPDGRIVRRLEEADVSRLSAIGWRPGQTFTVKARDGITDIHGVLYLPPNIDSTKKYPIIDHIYPGPQVGSVGTWSFKSGGEAFALAELGFVVMQLDHLGTPLRSKAFHDSYYGNFGDNGLPDHITAIKQLAARHRFIDIDRVGIFGHSGGGFASTDAILRYPDFFKVAVSGAGNHDNRSYNIYWAEKYQGLLTRDTLRKTDNFEGSANKTLAKNLKGHLLLIHGDMDDNVHPANTIQLVDELIRANRTFDLIMAPNRAHGLNEPYFIRRRWDYFVQHLMGATPPENYEITRPADASGGGGDGTPP